MKKLLLVLALLLCSCALAEDYAPDCGYTLFFSDGKFGLKQGGEVVLPAQYDEIGGFSRWEDVVDRCWLMKDGKYGVFPGGEGCAFEVKPDIFRNYALAGGYLCDLAGKRISQERYIRMQALSDDRVALWPYTGTDGDWEKANAGWGADDQFRAPEAVILDGGLKEIFRLQCSSMSKQSEGLIQFTDYHADSGYWAEGFVTLDGEVEYFVQDGRMMYSFTEGFAITSADSGGYGLMNRKFKTVLKAEYDWISPIIDGHFIVMKKLEDGYDCILTNTKLEKLLHFEIGEHADMAWCNGKIIVNDGDYDLFYVHDLRAKLLLKAKWVNRLSGGMAAYQDLEGRWGYIDQNGSIAVRAQYAEAGDFANGFAPVKTVDGKWMFINKTGANPFGRDWDYVEGFRDGEAYVRDNRGGAYINTAGEILRPAMAHLDSSWDNFAPYTPAGAADEAVVKIYAENHGLRIFEAEDGRFGLMDGEENILLSAVYEDINPPTVWADGVARCLLRRGERWGWYGADGASDCLWMEVLFAFGGRICVQDADSGMYRLVNADGSFADEMQYEKAVLVAENLLALKRMGRDMDFVDADFNVRFSLDCENVSSEREGVFRFRRDNLYGYCALDGRIIVPAKYEDALEYRDGYGRIGFYGADWNRLGLADRNGSIALEIGKYVMLYDFLDGCAVAMTKDNGKMSEYVVLDTSLNETFAFAGNYSDHRNGNICWYDGKQDVLANIDGEILFTAADIRMHTGEYSAALIEDGGERKWGFIDDSGRIAIDAQFADTHGFAHGLAAVRRWGSDVWEYIDRDGNTVIDGGWLDAYDFDESGYASVTDMDKNEWTINRSGEVCCRQILDGNPWF